jgi:hypothetical protein
MQYIQLIIINPGKLIATVTDFISKLPKVGRYCQIFIDLVVIEVRKRQISIPQKNWQLNRNIFHCEDSSYILKIFYIKIQLLWNRNSLRSHHPNPPKFNYCGVATVCDRTIQTLPNLTIVESQQFAIAPSKPSQI